MNHPDRSLDQLRDDLRPVWDERRAAAVFAGAQRTAARAKRRRFGAMVVCGAAVAAVALLVARPRGSDRALAWPDGSRVAPLTNDTSLQISERATGRIAATVSRGSARFAVAADRGRVFRVVAGSVIIDVIGCEFTVDRVGDGAVVAVERGSAEVTWGSRATDSATLGAGERGAFPPAAPAPAAAPSVATAPLARVPPAPARPARHAAAARPVASAESPADLMKLADRARQEHRPSDAVRALRQVFERHAGHELAPLAAFSAGRVLVDELARFEEGAQAFALAQRLLRAQPSSSRGGLAEDALVREAEAWARAGHKDRARALASEQLREHPGTRYRSQLEALSRP